MSIGPYALGDRPATPVEIEVTSDEDLTGYTAASVSLVSPSGLVIPNVPSGFEDDRVAFLFPEGALDTEAGVWSLRIRLTGPSASITLPAIRFVVEGPSAWTDLATLRESWSDAPRNDVWCLELLELAREQCLAYAPIADGQPVTTRHRRAQVLQARSLWNFTKTDPTSNLLGDGAFAIKPYPLENFIKQILRPKKAMGFIARGPTNGPRT